MEFSNISLKFLSKYLLLGILWLPFGNSSLEWHLVTNGSSAPTITGRRDAAIGFDASRNRLVLFGGRTVEGQTERVLGDTIIYDISRNQWVLSLASPSPAARFSMVYGTSGDYFYIATGEGRNNIYYNDLWRFNFRTEEWEILPEQTKPSYYSADQWAFHQDSSVAPERRYAAAGGIFPNASRFYISLGFSDVRHKDTLSYSLQDWGWYIDSVDRGPYHPHYPHARCLHAGTMISHDELLIFGGCLSGGGTGGACPSADSWVFNGKTKTWTEFGSCASPRTNAALAMLPITGGERRVILYGGQEEGPGRQVITTIASPKEQIGVLNPETKEWALREATGDIPSKRTSVSMVTGKNGIYMFGGYELETDTYKNDVYILLGRSDEVDRAPLQAQCNPTFFSLIILHGVLMALAWGFFLPWGAFIARYMRHNDPLWYNLHKLFQIFGLILAIGGFVCSILSVQGRHFQFVHAIVGLTVTVLGVLQPINALMRPHAPRDGAKKSTRRFVWEVIHSFSGRSAIGLGLANISMGVFLAHSHRLIWILWFAYLGFILLTHFIAETLYYRRDLYKSKPSTNGDVGDQYVVKKIIPAQNVRADILDNFKDDTEL